MALGNREKTMAKRFDFYDRNTAAKKVRLGNVTYAVMLDGSYRRTSPMRPWRGKAERKRVIRARVEIRETLNERV